MRRLSLLLPMLLVLWCLYAYETQAATYYVSTSGSGTTCSLAAPCGSINTGISKLTAGDTLLLRGGTYAQSINSSSNVPSGTSYANAVTIAAAPGETVILRPGTVAIDLNTFGSGAYHYIIFDGLIIDGSASSGTVTGVFFGGANTHHIRMQNTEVGSWGGTFVSGGGGQGVQVFGADSIEFINLNVHNNGNGRLDHGFYVCGTNMILRNSSAHDNAGYGIQVYDSSNNGCSNGTHIFNNRIYNNNGDGGVTLNHGSNIQFYNNLVYGNHGGGIEPVCYGTVNNLHIYNNTFYNNAGSPLEICAGITSTDVKNNIFSNNTASIVNNGTSTGFASNLCGATGTGCTAIGGPSFVNAGTANFALNTGSPAIDAGTTLAEVATDFAGVTRPQGTAYDIGAYEFVVLSSPITVYVAPTGDDARSCATAQNIATPRQTVAGGIGCLITGGSTLYIRAGTYDERIDTGTQFIAGGSSWSAPTTIAAYAGETVTLRLPVSAAGSPVVWFQNAAQDHYIVLDRLILDGQFWAGSNGLVYYNGTHHLRFQNGEVKNTYWESVYISSANNTEVLNSKLHDSTHEHGVHIVGTVDGTLIQGNEVSASVGSGIRAVGSDDPIGTITNTTIRGNKAHGNGAGSNLAALVAGGTGHTGAVVVNNVVYGNYAGIQVTSGLSGGKLTNNTVVNNSTVGIQIDAGATSTSIINNISGGNGTQDLLNNGTGTAQGTNLLSLPAFINAPAGDYHLAASALTAIDAGTTQAEAATDFDGVARPQNAAYDIGAFEFVGVPGAPPAGVMIAVPWWQAGGMFRR